MTYSYRIANIVKQISDPKRIKLISYSDFDCAFMVVEIKNQKVALASITLWFT